MSCELQMPSATESQTNCRPMHTYNHRTVRVAYTTLCRATQGPASGRRNWPIAYGQQHEQEPVSGSPLWRGCVAPV